MNAKEVKKGIEENELRENATGWSILQILFVSAASMVPFGHWMGSIIVLITLITLFSIKKIRLIANIVLTLVTSIFVAGFCFIGLGLITAIVGFVISIIFFGIKNVLNYMHNIEDWADEEKEKKLKNKNH